MAAHATLFCFATSANLGLQFVEEQTVGDRGGQRSLAGYSPGAVRESADLTTEQQGLGGVKSTCPGNKE